MFTIIYILIFSVFSLMHQNYEFIYYSIVLLILVNFIMQLHKRMLFAGYILVGLSIVGFIHILGGNVYIDGVRLYDYYLISDIVRYDNLVHAASSFIFTFVSYALIKPYIDPDLKVRPFSLYMIMFFSTMGIGAINEVIEYFAVIWLDVGAWVGDYYNNALDLVFNGVGSLLACFYMATRKKLIVLQKEFRISERIAKQYKKRYKRGTN